MTRRGRVKGKTCNAGKVEDGLTLEIREVEQIGEAELGDDMGSLLARTQPLQPPSGVAFAGG
jgi:hypothetical protein